MLRSLLAHSTVIPDRDYPCAVFTVLPQIPCPILMRNAKCDSGPLKEGVA